MNWLYYSNPPGSRDYRTKKIETALPLKDDITANLIRYNVLLIY